MSLEFFRVLSPSTSRAEMQMDRKLVSLLNSTIPPGTPRAPGGGW
jgi:hypothetical protein